MTQEQTDAYAKGFKIGWDKAEERILKLIDKISVDMGHDVIVRADELIKEIKGEKEI